MTKLLEDNVFKNSVKIGILIIIIYFLGMLNGQNVYIIDVVLWTTGFVIVVNMMFDLKRIAISLEKSSNPK